MTDLDHAKDPGVRHILDHLSQLGDDMDDGESPFGCYAVCTWPGDTNSMTIGPDQDEDHWTDEDGNELGVPLGPVVRVTVERIR